MENVNRPPRHSFPPLASPSALLLSSLPASLPSPGLAFPFPPLQLGAVFTIVKTQYGVRLQDYDQALKQLMQVRLPGVARVHEGAPPPVWMCDMPSCDASSCGMPTTKPVQYAPKARIVMHISVTG